ncbi:hypothetical protein TIFTF001_049618 [Ficus carica]|uniref:Uncharacterized protein n=1 Tax=Ficus carica TaxID=3494 RepID=A0AA88CU62_FICCA|nr:hypothetical protein TIFTF001_049612 [Ficus carica]GMN30419.1 hypothetical protein TIFTF001_049618 [Ficus carica]
MLDILNPTWFTVHRISPVLLSHPCLAPVPESRLPPLRRPCAAVSGSVGCAPIPSSICCVAGALVTGPPSSLPFDYIVDLLPSPIPRQADAAPSEVWETTANLWADYPLFPSSEINWPTRQFLP